MWVPRPLQAGEIVMSFLSFAIWVYSCLIKMKLQLTKQFLLYSFRYVLRGDGEPVNACSVGCARAGIQKWSWLHPFRGNGSLFFNTFQDSARWCKLALQLKEVACLFPAPSCLVPCSHPILSGSSELRSCMFLCCHSQLRRGSWSFFFALFSG